MHQFIRLDKIYSNSSITYRHIYLLFIQIKEKKYIFLYGGQDNEWIQKFPEREKVLVDQDLIKQKGISIQLVPSLRAKERST